MALRPEQLPSALERDLSPVYLLAGAEPLLLQECRDAVIRAAQERGYAERSVHEVSGKFDWNQLAEESSVPSLFSSQKILDIRLPTGKPGADGAKVLTAMAENPDPDLLLLVSSGEWSRAMRRLKWTGKLAQAGVLVEIWPVRPQELPGWIRTRMQRAGLKPDREAVALLAELVEGNLLAAQQEIDKLLMADRDPRVTVDDITRSVANSARFDAFRLVECALNGKLDECLRVASGLQRTGVAIQPVYAALYRELMVAADVSSAASSGEGEAAAFKRWRVWPARQGAIRQIMRRLPAEGFGTVFRTLSLIDRQSKGRAQGDAWQTLDRLLWFICRPGEVVLP
ncbi:MAG: DNA polymerase III subunit delta [Xanthomonadales bacterium]|nr:DNA polymerase III subunit delta [Gammaproteobacteria bacterium]NNJ78723.1 DNA polymerase III subunit delta [Xanthomonadales bacterium]NNL05540.1 DNA polymerase III subunit delta [Xanthomonadales bacterium]